MDVIRFLGAKRPHRKYLKFLNMNVYQFLGPMYLRVYSVGLGKFLIFS